MQGMARPSKTVRQHNAERLQFYKNTGRRKPAGIACPWCGEGMVQESDTILLSEPPKVMVTYIYRRQVWKSR